MWLAKIHTAGEYSPFPSEMMIETLRLREHNDGKEPIDLRFPEAESPIVVTDRLVQHLKVEETRRGIREIIRFVFSQVSCIENKVFFTGRYIVGCDNQVHLADSPSLLAVFADRISNPDNIELPKGGKNKIGNRLIAIVSDVTCEEATRALASSLKFNPHVIGNPVVIEYPEITTPNISEAIQIALLKASVPITIAPRGKKSIVVQYNPDKQMVEISNGKDVRPTRIIKILMSTPMETWYH